MTILDRSLLIVGGKGGTGKSSVAAALGKLSAERGKRTLVVSADGTPGAAGRFGVAPLDVVTEVTANLSVLQIDSRTSLREFVALQLGPLARVAGPVASAFSFVAEAAPGVSELLLVGKYAEEVRSGGWDLVVVDAASSGHLLGELAAPAGVGEIAPIGRLARETGWIVDMLADRAITGVVNVTIAEELPVAETIEFVEELHANTPATLAAVVVNKTRPQLYARTTRSELVDYLQDPPARLTIGARGLLDAVNIGLERADIASALDTRLRSALPPHTPVLRIPEFGFVDPDLDVFCRAIADEFPA